MARYGGTTSAPASSPRHARRRGSPSPTLDHREPHRATKRVAWCGPAVRGSNEMEATATANGALLSLEGVTKRFGPVQALDGVDFEVRAGEVIGLVGDNGAGKSTLIKAIAGVAPADEGELRFDGRPVRVHSPTDSAALGIAFVYQDLALCDN